MKVEIEELDSLLVPDDLDVDFRRIIEEARGKKGYSVFETFSSAPKEAECSVAAKFILFTKWEECAVCVAAKLVFVNEWKTVASGLGRAASCVELV